MFQEVLAPYFVVSNQENVLKCVTVRSVRTTRLNPSVYVDVTGLPNVIHLAGPTEVSEETVRHDRQQTPWTEKRCTGKVVYDDQSRIVFQTDQSSSTSCVEWTTNILVVTVLSLQCDVSPSARCHERSNLRAK